MALVRITGSSDSTAIFARAAWSVSFPAAAPRTIGSLDSTAIFASDAWSVSSATAAIFARNAWSVSFPTAVPRTIGSLDSTAIFASDAWSVSFPTAAPRTTGSLDSTATFASNARSVSFPTAAPRTTGASDSTATFASNAWSVSSRTAAVSFPQAFRSPCAHLPISPSTSFTFAATSMFVNNKAQNAETSAFLFMASSLLEGSQRFHGAQGFGADLPPQARRGEQANGRSLRLRTRYGDGVFQERSEESRQGKE